MFKQIKFIQKYSITIFKQPEITYSIFNCISKRRYYTNNEEATKIETDASQNHTIFEPYALSNTQSIILNRKKENLYDILNVGSREGFDIVTECPKLRKLSLSVIKARVKLYTEKGVSMQILLKYPWLLTLPENKIKPKLRVIETLPLTFNESICFLRQNNIRLLNKVCKLLTAEYNETKINRMRLVAEKLQVHILLTSSNSLLFRTYYLAKFFHHLTRIENSPVPN